MNIVNYVFLFLTCASAGYLLGVLVAELRTSSEVRGTRYRGTRYRARVEGSDATRTFQYAHMRLLHRWLKRASLNLYVGFGKDLSIRELERRRAAYEHAFRRFHDTARNYNLSV